MLDKRPTQSRLLVVLTCAALLSLGCKQRESRSDRDAEALRSSASAPAVSSAAAAPTASVAPGDAAAIEPKSDMIVFAKYSFVFGGGLGERDETDLPLRKVTVGPFAIDRTEVTVASFQRCVAASQCSPIVPGTVAGADLCNTPGVGRDDHPVNCVTRTQAQRYCEATGRRLPTEAEWEWAAKAERKLRRRWINPDDDGMAWELVGAWRSFPWGDQEPGPKRLNACGPACREAMKGSGLAAPFPLVRQDDGYATTAPVGHFPEGASDFGVADLIGNVAEWVVEAEVADAGAEGKGVVRGGSWGYGLGVTKRADLRLTRRHKLGASSSDPRVGFRCARDATEQEPEAAQPVLAPDPPRPGGGMWGF